MKSAKMQSPLDLPETCGNAFELEEGRQPSTLDVFVAVTGVAVADGAVGEAEGDGWQSGWVETRRPLTSWSCCLDHLYLVNK